MKKNFFPMALMAIAMGLNACSSDDPVVNASGGKAPFADGGYVKMAINMPSAPSGRAANDDFVNSDGLPKEYEVKDATLILFEGKSSETEDQAIFHSVYKLPVSMTKEGVQITSTTRIISKVQDKQVPNAGYDKLYAYVVLNHNDKLIYDPANHTELTINGTPMGSTKMTFGNFRQQEILGSEADFNGSGFLMNNAPLSNKVGGGTKPTDAKITSLVDISNHVYKSKAEAEGAAADEVFVERALAKVTVEDKVEGGKHELEGGDVKPVVGGSPSTPQKVKYTIEGWTLDVTNKKSFFGRNYKSSWNVLCANGVTSNPYRFIGSTKLRTYELYRTYWATDPNYDSFVKADANKNFAYATKKITVKKEDGSGGTEDIDNDGRFIKTGLGENSPMYCMENTFDVDNMENRQMTRAIVKVKFFDGNDFYTFNDDNATLYDNANMQKRVKEVILHNGAVIDKLKQDADFSGATITEANIGLNFRDRNENGLLVLDNYTVTVGSIMKTYKVSTTPKPGSTTETYANLNEELSLGNIVEYKGGIAYYPIRIKHFGDELTPWDSKTATVENPYGTTNKDENFLGRYGVLRNNWYNIEISSIKKVGSAVVPEIDVDDPTSGDKPENYISVRINILSWAKRTQSEIL